MIIYFVRYSLQMSIVDYLDLLHGGYVLHGFYLYQLVFFINLIYQVINNLIEMFIISQQKNNYKKFKQ